MGPARPQSLHPESARRPGMLDPWTTAKVDERVRIAHRIPDAGEWLWRDRRLTDCRSGTAGVVRGRRMPAPLEAFADALGDLVAVDRAGEQQQTGGDELLGVAAAGSANQAPAMMPADLVRTSSRPWANSASSTIRARISGRSTRRSASPWRAEDRICSAVDIVLSLSNGCSHVSSDPDKPPESAPDRGPGAPRCPFPTGQARLPPNTSLSGSLGRPAKRPCPPGGGTQVPLRP